MAGPGGGRVGRSWRRFRRRPAGVQVVSVIVAVGLVVAVVFAVGTGSSPTHGNTTTTTGATATPVEASASSAGVTTNSIRVVFPVSNLSGLASTFGFAGDIEYSEQAKAINLFVKLINDAGGIHGRKIDADIVNFDPTNEAEMRSLCKDWTDGSSPAFAVLDGVGTLTGDNELCITQEGHTPLISQWTTVTNWTQEGSPYLWWTGPDDAAILQATVDWGTSAGLLGGGIKVGVVAGDRASDQLALNQYLLPDLRQAGITPIVKTIAADPSDTASTDAQAPLVVQQLRVGRSHLDDPAHTVQRLLPRAGGRDTTAVLPPSSYCRTTRTPSSRRSACCRSPTRKLSTARRGSRPRPWEASMTTGLNPRGATTPVCAAASTLGTRPTRRFPQATRTTSSRSRDRSRGGARRFACSRPPPRRPAGISTDGRSTPPCPRSPTSPGVTPRS